ncbi:two-component system response regulator RppA [Synechococcus elongatus IITB7]|uniref:two-component system response regulator RppA n=1 Tax=Synechococcus elongatus TaxID=32046 RepID=UPI0030CA612E
MRILLVDDEEALTAPLHRMLCREGYEVDVASDGQTGEQMATQQVYDLLILDWMLPERSGLELCRSVRSRDRQVPVLFLTARDTVDDRVQGLDAGADDYLVKPFELKELLARVRALLRRLPRQESPEVPRLCCGDLALDVPNQLAYRQGRCIELSEKETQLLAVLMQHPGQLVSHQALQSQVWGLANPPSSNVLAAQIRLLRRKLEAPGETPLIFSVYGKGYRFQAADSV